MEGKKGVFVLPVGSEKKKKKKHSLGGWLI